MATTVTVSSRLRSAVWAKRAAGMKQYELARAADVNVSVFSSLVNDIVPIQRNDPRVVRIGALLGLSPAECFDERGR
jgi:hypothetical protein